MKRLLVCLAIAMFVLPSIGCKSGESFDENYKTEVNMTPDQKAKMEADSAKHPAPGTAKAGEPITPINGAPSASMPMPKKGR